MSAAALRVDRAPVHALRGTLLTLVGCAFLLLVSIKIAEHVADLRAPLNPLLGESRTGTVFKLLLDGIFALLAVQVVHAGLRLFDTKRETPSDFEEQLVRLLAREQTRVPEYRPPESHRFEDLSNEDLIAVYHSINREEFPDRFGAILWVMYRRASQLDVRHLHDARPSEK